MRSRITKKTGIGLGFIALALLLPLVVSSNYIISLLVYCFCYAAMGASWNIIGGYGGQTCWCHATFLAIGAYTGMILLKNFEISPFLSIPIAMAISFLIALIIGSATLRLRGAFFTISTMALLEISRIILTIWDSVTGGSSGLYNAYQGTDFWKMHFENDVPFYYITFFLLLLVVFIVSRFVKSKTGYYLGAINGDEDAALSLGIRSFRIKLRSFELSAMLTAMVGTVFGAFLAYIDPATICSMDMSIKIASVAIIGGLGTLWGPVLGAFIIVPATELAGIILGKIGSSVLLYGLTLILVVLFKPKGVISIFHKDMFSRFRQRRLKTADGKGERG